MAFLVLCTCFLGYMKYFLENILEVGLCKGDLRMSAPLKVACAELQIICVLISFACYVRSVRENEIAKNAPVNCRVFLH